MASVPSGNAESKVPHACRVGAKIRFDLIKIWLYECRKMTQSTTTGEYPYTDKMLDPERKIFYTALDGVLPIPPRGDQASPAGHGLGGLVLCYMKNTTRPSFPMLILVSQPALSSIAGPSNNGTNSLSDYLKLVFDHSGHISMSMHLQFRLPFSYCCRSHLSEGQGVLEYYYFLEVGDFKYYPLRLTRKVKPADAIH